MLDPATITPAPPVALAPEPRTFAGYRRPGQRGVGTRNYLVILGTTSRTASFARRLAARLQVLARVVPALDGIVAVAHTEGGGPGEPNNATEVLRALAGFMVHPNVGAVLAVDYGVEPVTNARLRDFMTTHGYPLADVPHAFLSVRAGLAAALAEGEAMVRRWLPAVAAQTRTPAPLSALRVALQCGGSDAFSGVSGNPLAGAMVHEVVRHGGIGVLCETDELAGAESYMMKKVRDLATARALLGAIDRFRTRLSWHGVTPESNPSAGNKYRGLYNITLKSLGAVHKKDPRTRVDARHRLRRAALRARVSFHEQPRERPGRHRRAGGRGLQPVSLRHRQRLHHELPLRAHAEDDDHHPAAPAAGPWRWISTRAAISTASRWRPSPPKGSSWSSPPHPGRNPAGSWPGTPRPRSGAIGARPMTRIWRPSAPARCRTAGRWRWRALSPTCGRRRAPRASGSTRSTCFRMETDLAPSGSAWCCRRACVRRKSHASPASA